MRVIILVNDARDLKPGQTTTAIAAACAARSLETLVASAAELGIRPDGLVTVRGLTVPVRDPEALPAALTGEALRSVGLRAGDRVWIRTNPGRDPRGWVTGTMLDLLDHARAQGVVVLNRPDALRRASSKLFLHSLPGSIRPSTLVSRDPQAIRQFLEACPEGAVLKPLDGTQGRDVFRVRAGRTDNLNQIVDLLTRGGFCMAQAFVPEAMDGDVRLIMVNGALLTVRGRAAAVRRVPSGADFRSNVHVGGRPVLESPGPRLLEVARIAGAALQRQDIFLCGLDVIGDRVVEANVFSPGGLTDAGAFAGVDFLGTLVEAFLEA